MVNKNYEKGRNKEYATVNKLKKAGYDIVQRSAGSHSPIDVFAINKTCRVIKLVQCKPNGFSDKKRKEIEFEMNWLNNMFRVEFEVI